MRLKIYRAPSMAEAMARLRAELGPEALILGARTLRDGVELTAGIDPADLAEPAPAAMPAVPAAAPTASRAPIWPAAAIQSTSPGAAIRAIAMRHRIPEELAERMTGASVAESLGRIVRFAPIAPERGPLLFVGPPGAGKTSTVARLATRLVLGGVRPMVLTADGQRAGATEQLAAYTRLLGLNLIVATHPTPLARAMTRRDGAAPVLIDAPGCDAHDPSQLRDLAALAAAAQARIALVLPAGLDTQEAAEIAANYAAIGASLMVATRIDLARRLGSVLAAAQAGGLALAEAGIGPGAADGLVPIDAAMLTERLLREPPAHRPAPTQEAHA